MSHDPRKQTSDSMSKTVVGQNQQQQLQQQLSSAKAQQNQDRLKLLSSEQIIESSSTTNELDDFDGDPDSDPEPAADDPMRQRRILECRRLSEGLANNVRLTSSAARKNSLHMIEGNLLPPVTEGKTMEHISTTDCDNNATNAGADSGGSQINNSKSSSRYTLRDFKRNSSFSNEDQQTASCSSSISLEIDTSKRRNSSVSQCSSVLSEGTRNQLNFDLSPDLPPDSTLLEANSISPTTDIERPPSPEPSVGLFDLEFSRPESRLSNREDDDDGDAATAVDADARRSPDSTQNLRWPPRC